MFNFFKDFPIIVVSILRGH